MRRRAGLATNSFAVVNKEANQFRGSPTRIGLKRVGTRSLSLQTAHSLAVHCLPEDVFTQHAVSRGLTRVPWPILSPALRR